MKKTTIIATFFACFIQSAYGMDIIDCCPIIPLNKEAMTQWYADNEEKIKRDLHISPHTSVYLPYAEIGNKRYASILTPNQIAELDFKGIMSLGRNAGAIDMNPLVNALSSSASLAKVHPLTFAIKVALDLRANTNLSKEAIKLIVPSSDENKEEIINQLRPRLAYLEQQDSILEMIRQKPISISSSLRSTTSFMIGGTMLIGLIYILVTYGKIYAKDIHRIT